LAGISPGRLYKSINGGVAWSETQPAGAVDKAWTCAATSGNPMLVGVSGGRLYLSTDAGTTWGETQPAGAVDKTWLTASAYGTRLMAGASIDRLYASSNTGTTWGEEQPAGAVDKNWVCSSISSALMLAGVYGGRLYYERYVANSLTIRRTVTDMFGTVGATTEDIVGPGASFSYSWDDLIGAALPPYTDVKVEIKSTTPGSPAAFQIAALTLS
jgi:hypothetical protein